MSDQKIEAVKDERPAGLALATGSAISRKDRAWRRYRASECFAADGKANAFSKGFDAGEVITPDKWNDLVGSRDALMAALQFIADNGGQNHETECGTLTCNGSWCAEQARSALPNVKDQPRAGTEK